MRIIPVNSSLVTVLLFLCHVLEIHNNPLPFAACELSSATQKLSPNAPPSHTLNIYSMPGAKGLYEYLSMSGGAVTVTDKTVKGTVKFFKIAADGSSETFKPTLEGNIDLQCP